MHHDSSSSSSTNSDLSQPLDITEHLLHTAGEDAAYIEQSISNIARLLESPLGLRDGVDAAFEWLLRPDAQMDRSDTEATLIEKRSTATTKHPPLVSMIRKDDDCGFSLMDIASNALGASAKAIVDSPGTIKIISALSGRSRMAAGADPTELCDSVIGAAAADTIIETRSRSVVFRLEESNPMIEELQRCTTMDALPCYTLYTHIPGHHCLLLRHM